MNVFSTGIAPAIAHGAEVNGLSESELRIVQSVAAAASVPSSAGRSMAATRLLKGDSTWRAATAAASLAELLGGRDPEEVLVFRSEIHWDPK